MSNLQETSRVSRIKLRYRVGRVLAKVPQSIDSIKYTKTLMVCLIMSLFFIVTVFYLVLETDTYDKYRSTSLGDLLFNGLFYGGIGVLMFPLFLLILKQFVSTNEQIKDYISNFKSYLIVILLVLLLLTYLYL